MTEARRGDEGQRNEPRKIANIDITDYSPAAAVHLAYTDQEFSVGCLTFRDGSAVVILPATPIEEYVQAIGETDDPQKIDLQAFNKVIKNRWDPIFRARLQDATIKFAFPKADSGMLPILFTTPIPHSLAFDLAHDLCKKWEQDNGGNGAIINVTTRLRDSTDMRFVNGDGTLLEAEKHKQREKDYYLRICQGADHVRASEVVPHLRVMKARHN